MKILITTQIVDRHSPLLGFFHSWIEEFAKRFDEVHVICLSLGDHTLPSNVVVYSLGKEGGESRLKYTIRFYRYVAKIFFRVRVDYVFFHMGAVYNLMALPFFLLRRLYGTQFYWWKTHGHIDIMGRLASVCVDRIYTAVEESFPVETSRRHVIGHAIDTTLFTPGPIAKQPHSLLFIGRFARSKRLEQVMKVTKRLVDEGIPVSSTFIGSVVDEEYFSELDTLSKELRVVDNVTFIKGLSQPELVAKYQSAHVFMSPSDNDGLDKVFLESILCGTLPVTGNVSFEKLLGPHNLFLEKGDINGYVERVQRIFSMSEADYNGTIEALQTEVKERHSLDTLMERIFSD